MRGFQPVSSEVELLWTRHWMDHAWSAHADEGSREDAEGDEHLERRCEGEDGRVDGLRAEGTPWTDATKHRT